MMNRNGKGTHQVTPLQSSINSAFWLNVNKISLKNEQHLESRVVRRSFNKWLSYWVKYGNSWRRDECSECQRQQGTSGDSNAAPPRAAPIRRFSWCQFTRWVHLNFLTRVFWFYLLNESHDWRLNSRTVTNCRHLRRTRRFKGEFCEQIDWWSLQNSIEWTILRSKIISSSIQTFVLLKTRKRASSIDSQHMQSTALVFYISLIQKCSFFRAHFLQTVTLAIKRTLNSCF